MEASKQMIADLKDKQAVKSVFLVSSLQTLMDRNGKPYLSFDLGDASGSLNARLWDRVEELSQRFQSGDFVEIKGHAQLYQNRMQIVVHDITKTKVEAAQIKNFVLQGRTNPAQVFAEIEGFVECVKNPYIKQLLQLTLSDEEIRTRFLQSPAAKTIHHAYMGGLADHILSICKLMQAMGQNYSYLNTDYLYFGAIYHDIGKTFELKVEDGIRYTDVGRLVGHMGIACNMIETIAEKIPDFPSELKELLKHIVYSHHGKLEYGSPKTPMFLEAYVVAMIDELDSKLFTMFEFMNSELATGEKWTRYHQSFDRYFYLDVLREKK